MQARFLLKLPQQIGSNASASQLFSIDVVNVNRAPQLASNAPALVVNEDEMVTIKPISRVVDLDGDSLTLAGVRVDSSQGSSHRKCQQHIYAYT
jgi:hypothetical protein